MTLPNKDVAIAIIESYINSRASEWQIVGKDSKDFQIDKDAKFKYKVEICGELLLLIDGAKSEADWDQINQVIKDKIEVEKPLVKKNLLTGFFNSWIYTYSADLLLNALYALRDYIDLKSACIDTESNTAEKSDALNKYFDTVIKKWDSVRVTELKEKNWLEFQEDAMKRKRNCNVDLLNIAKEAVRPLVASKVSVALVKPSADDKKSVATTGAVSRPALAIDIPKPLESPISIVVTRPVPVPAVSSTKPTAIPVKPSYANVLKANPSFISPLLQNTLLRPSPVHAPQMLVPLFDEVDELPSEPAVAVTPLRNFSVTSVVHTSKKFHKKGRGNKKTTIANFRY